MSRQINLYDPTLQSLDHGTYNATFLVTEDGQVIVTDMYKRFASPLLDVLSEEPPAAVFAPQMHFGIAGTVPMEEFHAEVDPTDEAAIQADEGYTVKYDTDGFAIVPIVEDEIIQFDQEGNVIDGDAEVSGEFPDG